MKKLTSVLLIISGSIAAYKSLELIRLLRARDISVHAILSKGGAQFITPLAVSSLTGNKTYGDLFSLTDEVEMGHIQLSRMADAILVAPASANMIAKMANGQCDDLASTALLATNKPVYIAPAMNHKMWEHPATKRNIAQLLQDGIKMIAPTKGSMACNEEGMGRLAELEDIVEAVLGGQSAKNNGAISMLTPLDSLAEAEATPLAGLHAIITSGPTHEPVDPVRYMGNRSSGKQGHAIATALANLGAKVTLVSGPVGLADPDNTNITTQHINTATQMHEAVIQALPADIFIGAAAVADWQIKDCATQKMKKENATDTLTLSFCQTRDILHDIGHHKQRPKLVIGFAAETENLMENAAQKRSKKQADWIIANNVSQGVFGADNNEITILSDQKPAIFPRMSKQAIAQNIALEVAGFFAEKASKTTQQKQG
jgi:phosphopantothenoylcysteine decarboxylase/phosphopantothenate--cysteine ligase